jgi:hypothetical protein
MMKNPRLLLLLINLALIAAWLAQGRHSWPDGA